MSGKFSARRFSPRPFYSSIIAFSVAVSAAVLLIVTQTENPIAALRSFFTQPFSSPWFLGNMLDQSALFLTAGLGIVLSFRGGTFNLGGEGQVYIGGLAASALLLSMQNIPGPIVLMLACAAALTAGAAMGALSRKKARRNLSLLFCYRQLSFPLPITAS